MEKEPEFQVSLNPEVLKKEIIITNQDEFLQAGDVLKLCKDKIKEVEAERKSYTDPLEQSKKRLIAKAKLIIEPIEAYIEKINQAMSGYHQVQEKLRQEEEKKIAAEQKAYYDKCQAEAKMPNDVDLMTKQPEIEKTKTTKGNIATTSMVEKWEFEIIDELLLPREYLMPNEVAIRKAVTNGLREISGIKITKTFKPKSF